MMQVLMGKSDPREKGSRRCELKAEMRKDEDL